MRGLRYVIVSGTIKSSPRLKKSQVPQLYPTVSSYAFPAFTLRTHYALRERQSFMCFALVELRR